MESIQNTFLEDSIQEETMGRVLVTTVHSPDFVVLLATKLSAERIYLIVDKKPDDVQEQSIADINKTFGKVLELKEKKVDSFDIVATAQSIVELIDVLPSKDEIYVNITSGRKTQAIAVLLAAYKRSDRIKKIFYVNPETKEIITMPLLSLDLTHSQQKILESIDDGKDVNFASLAEKLKLSRAIVYRGIKQLKDKGLLEGSDKGLRLTDAGKIARL